MTLNVIKWQAAMQEYRADLLIWKAHEAEILREIKKLASGKISNRFGSIPEAKDALIDLWTRKPTEPTLGRV